MRIKSEKGSYSRDYGRGGQIRLGTTSRQVESTLR